MLNSAEHDYFIAHKCQNANNCWHFGVYEQKKELSRLISKYRLIRKKILQGFDSADINDYKICSDGQSFVTQWA